MIELNCSSGYQFGFNTFHLRNTGSNAFFKVELVGILFGLKTHVFYLFLRRATSFITSCIVPIVKTCKKAILSSKTWTTISISSQYFKLTFCKEN